MQEMLQLKLAQLKHNIISTWIPLLATVNQTLVAFIDSSNPAVLMQSALLHSSNGKMLLTDLDKAQCLSNYFGSVFTVEKPAPVSLGASSHPVMPDILVTNPGVLKLLSSLDTKNQLDQTVSLLKYWRKQDIRSHQF